MIPLAVNQRRKRNGSTYAWRKFRSGSSNATAGPATTAVGRPERWTTRSPAPWVVPTPWRTASPPAAPATGGRAPSWSGGPQGHESRPRRSQWRHLPPRRKIGRSSGDFADVETPLGRVHLRRPARGRAGAMRGVPVKVEPGLVKPPPHIQEEVDRLVAEALGQSEPGPKRVQVDTDVNGMPPRYPAGGPAPGGDPRVDPTPAAPARLLERALGQRLVVLRRAWACVALCNKIGDAPRMRGPECEGCGHSTVARYGTPRAGGQARWWECPECGWRPLEGDDTPRPAQPRRRPSPGAQEHRPVSPGGCGSRGCDPAGYVAAFSARLINRGVEDRRPTTVSPRPGTPSPCPLLRAPPIEGGALTTTPCVLGFTWSPRRPGG